MDKFYSNPWGKQLIDQLGHIGLGILVTGPMLLLNYAGWRTFLAASLIAVLTGVIREFAQMAKARKGWYIDRTIDSLFHLPGGLAIAALSCYWEITTSIT